MTENTNINDASPLEQVNRDLDDKKARQRAASSGLSYIDLRHFSIDIDALRLSTKQEAEEAHAIPVDLFGKKVRLAFLGEKSAAAEKLAQKLEAQGLKVEWVICSMTGLEEGLRQYDSHLFVRHGIQLRTDAKETENQELTSHLQDFEQLKPYLKSMSSGELLNEIELLAVSAQASDIHFQPVDKGMVVRVRVDGVLHNVLEMPLDVGEKLVTRIKYEAGMRANISDAPQDGAIEFEVNKRKVELRVSTIPTPTVESVVFRILDSDRGILGFSELGFASHIEEKINKVLHRHNGIILVTGPTGSGKTTTLYSMLSQLNVPERKIVTLEDPIEYHLKGASQSQVNEQSHYNFETGFKSLLRQDPDIILVGEIRTLSTAKLAFEAALTGHTVLSSLHANSAIGAISRLRNLGVQDANTAPTLSALFAQRLVRRVCKHCAEKQVFQPDVRTQKAIDRIKAVLPEFRVPNEVFVAKGCDECSGTGYEGQIAVSETVMIDDTLREMILKGVFETEIQEYLREKTDFLSLWEDGVLKMLEGITTLDEIDRVVSEE